MATPRHSMSPVTYATATRHEDIAAIADLWREVYVEERQWLRPIAGPLVQDDYHASSTYLLARSGGRTVGTVRLVIDSAVGLPVERFMPLGPLKRHTTFAEAQRLMVAPDARHVACAGAPFGLWAGLVKACVHLCFATSISHVIADVFTDGSMLAKFRDLGFEQIGGTFIDSELDERSQSVAMLLTIERLLRRGYQTRDRFFSYLFEFDPAFELYPAWDAEEFTPAMAGRAAAVEVERMSAEFGPPSSRE